MKKVPISSEFRRMGPGLEISISKLMRINKFTHRILMKKRFVHEIEASWHQISPNNIDFRNPSIEIDQLWLIFQILSVGDNSPPCLV